MHKPPAPALDAFGTLVRLGLAAVWLISGALKVFDPAETEVAVDAYEVLPDGLVGPVATGLPLVELVLGTVLLAGAFTRQAAAASAVLLLLLMAAVTQAWARGLDIDCGCFGGGGQVAPGDTRYLQELGRDLGFLLLAAWLLVRPRTAIGMDSVLTPRPNVDGHDEVAEPTPGGSRGRG